MKQTFRGAKEIGWRKPRKLTRFPGGLKVCEPKEVKYVGDGKESGESAAVFCPPHPTLPVLFLTGAPRSCGGTDGARPGHSCQSHRGNLCSLDGHKCRGRLAGGREAHSVEHADISEGKEPPFCHSLSSPFPEVAF